jgi:hypothetical protein
MKRSAAATGRIVSATVLMLAAAFVGAGPAGAATTLQCTGVVAGGTYSSVVVPPGASCTLTNATVTGNVVVLSGGSLYLGNDVVLNNVSATSRPGNVYVSGSHVQGNIAIAHATAGDNHVFDSEVDGDVSLTDTAGTAYFAVISLSTVHGNVYFARNVPIYWNDVSANIIDGNVVYIDNDAFYSEPNVPVSNGLANDRIGGNLLCLRNTPPPEEVGTTVAGSQAGQCPPPPIQP